MEDNTTLNFRFQKIIMISQKQLYIKAQMKNHDPVIFQQIHNSHALALAQVCPNNLGDARVLTPLDLCDEISTGLRKRYLDYGRS